MVHHWCWCWCPLRCHCKEFNEFGTKINIWLLSAVGKKHIVWMANFKRWTNVHLKLTRINLKVLTWTKTTKSRANVIKSRKNDRQHIRYNTYVMYNRTEEETISVMQRGRARNWNNCPPSEIELSSEFARYFHTENF